MAFLDENGLAELWSLIAEKDDALAAADVKIATGSYTGTGTCGSGNPNKLTFAFVPKFVFVYPANNTYKNTGCFLVNGLTSYNGLGSDWSLSSGSYTSNTWSLSVTWAGKTVSWFSGYATDSIAKQAQQNVSGTVYYYFAIG